VSVLLGRSGLWDPAQVSDADFAYRAAVKRNRAAPPPRPKHALERVRLAWGTVTAACVAPETGIVFAGFGSGGLACFDPSTGAVATLHRVEEPSWPVVALAADACGEMLVAVRARVNAAGELCSYHRIRHAKHALTYAARQCRPLDPGSGPFVLTQVLSEWPEPVVGLWAGGRFTFLRGFDLVPSGGMNFGLGVETEGAALLTWHGEGPHPGVLFSMLGSFFSAEGSDAQAVELHTHWSASREASSPLRSPLVSHRAAAGNGLELAGVGNGSACWTELTFRSDFPHVDWEYEVTCTDRHAHPAERYLAACLVGPRSLAAVYRSGVDWLRAGAKLAPRGRTAAVLPSAVACFYSPPTNELLIVGADGELTRVPVPE
jgi:hypothetical protein